MSPNLCQNLELLPSRVTAALGRNINTIYYTKRSRKKRIYKYPMSAFSPPSFNKIKDFQTEFRAYALTAETKISIDL
jgi:hypothetical protein